MIKLVVYQLQLVSQGDLQSTALWYACFLNVAQHCDRNFYILLGKAVLHREGSLMFTRRLPFVSSLLMSEAS